MTQIRRKPVTEGLYNIGDAAPKGLTEVEAFGREVSAVIDKMCAQANLRFNEADDAIKRARDLLDASAAHVKEVMTSHISTAIQLAADAKTLREQVDGLSAEHAKVVGEGRIG